MTLTAASPFWVNVDVSGDCENWILDLSGDTHRCGARAVVPVIVGAGVNHLLAHTPNVLFSMPATADGSSFDWPEDANTIAPLYRFTYPDFHREGTSVDLRLILAPPERDQNWAASSNSYITVSLGPTNSTVRVFEQNSHNENYCQDFIYEQISINMGPPTNTWVDANVSTYGGMRIVDIMLQEQSAITLDSVQGHSAVKVGMIKTAGPILNDYHETVAETLHQYRSECMTPIASWCAQAKAAGFQTAVSGAVTADGLCVDTATDGGGWVNLFDHAVNARNADTPGIYDHAYRCGIGPEDTSNGTRAYRTIAVLAHANVEGKSSVRFETAECNATINVTLASVHWYYLNSGEFYVNSAYDEEGSTEQAARKNKIDVFGQTDNCLLHVYAIDIFPKYLL